MIVARNGCYLAKTGHDHGIGWGARVGPGGVGPGGVGRAGWGSGGRGWGAGLTGESMGTGVTR